MKINGKRVSVEIPTASQSDIAFLLIIFFLVTTTFAVKTGVSMEVPKKEAEARKVFEKDLGKIWVRKDSYFLNRKKVKDEDLKDSLENFHYDKVLVSVDYGVPYGRVALLLSFLQKNSVRLSIRMKQ